MSRILISETTEYIEKKVKVSGWVNSRRDHGKIVFLDLRDRSGVLQVVATSELIKEAKEEYVLEIEGTIQKRPIKMVNPELETGQVELQAEKINILAKAEAPNMDLKNLNISLPVLLDYRPITLRSEKIKSIFYIKEDVISGFRESLKRLGFTEFQAPAIVPANAEGGAAVFHIDYYKSDAFLAQSPQLYKQILVGVFERVFSVNYVFRAEPSVTTRHLAEYVSLDAEMGFIDSWQDLMDTCETVVKEIFSAIAKKYQKELKMFKVAAPNPNQKIPRLKLKEAQEIIFQRTKRDNRKENDLEPEDEKEICKYAKEKYDSDLIFITHFPTSKRPFYTFADPSDPEYTFSFDLLYQGLEIVTGGQRINDYDALVKNIKKWKLDPKDFSFYLQAFKYGLPPEGGFAIGSERLVKQMLNLENVREASLFPRDMTRIDTRITAPKTKKKIKK